jgi:hypothetical protein
MRHHSCPDTVFRKLRGERLIGKPTGFAEKKGLHLLHLDMDELESDNPDQELEGVGLKLSLDYSLDQAHSC